MSTTLAPLPGDASATRSYGKRYESVAERILEVSRALETLVSTERSQGEAIDALKETGRDTVDAIRAAQPRYHETALALVEFSVDLADAQQKANSAIGDANHGQTELSNLNHRRRNREGDRLDAMMANESEDEIDRIQRDIRHLDQEIDQVEYAISQASNRYHQAVEDREKAIQEAIGRIRPALDQLNDGVLDFVRGAFESLVEFAEAISQWISAILTAIVDALVKLVIALVVAVILVILVLVLITVLLIVLTLVTILVIHLLALALPPLLLYLAARLVRSTARELTTPTPNMQRRDPLNEGDYTRKPDEGKYENVFNNNNVIDSTGKAADSTDIEIVTIRNDAGEIVGYRVVLPSTQDWEELGPIFGDPISGDKGGLNDLGSNIGLRTLPLGPLGPYERAVHEAIQKQMALDHADPHTPIMLCGFSQGGILAGRMAADPNSPLNITAVVTAGAAIDDYPIPASVSVLSIQHPLDPVPWFDGKPGIETTANHLTVTAPPHHNEAVHGAISYAKTAGTYIDESNDPAVISIKKAQADFFGDADNETVNVYRGNE